MSDYYDVSLKVSREKILCENKNFDVIRASLEERGRLLSVFKDLKPDVVIHLAAQAGVRYSIENPRTFVESNLIGVFELLEAARAFPPQHLLCASTSSIYGANKDLPYSETAKSDEQISLYASTKKSNESMAHSYSHLFSLPITMFRFFTVYGPWGRPDMALFKFTKNILEGTPIEVYNNGEMKRDFTFVDDIARAIFHLIEVIPRQNFLKKNVRNDSLSQVAPFRIVNIGNSNPVNLLQFINAIEKLTGRTAVKTMMPMQQGDVAETWADCTLLKELTDYTPKTDILAGVKAFVDWYRKYYNL